MKLSVLPFTAFFMMASILLLCQWLLIQPSNQQVIANPQQQPSGRFNKQPVLIKPIIKIGGGGGVGDQNPPRLPLSFIARNVTVSYADRNLQFTNATYYYDYYLRAERIDLFSVNSTYLPQKTIINLYGDRTKVGDSIRVSTYVVQYQQLEQLPFIRMNCSVTNDYWQFGYGMNDMPYWAIKPQAGINYARDEYDGKLKYQLWQDKYNGEASIYHVVTETRDEFARILYSLDHMVELTLNGDQAPFTINPQNFNVKLFGCK